MINFLDSATDIYCENCPFDYNGKIFQLKWRMLKQPGCPTSFLQPSMTYPTSSKDPTTLRCNPDALPFPHQPIQTPHFKCSKNYKVNMTATFILPHVLPTQ